MDYERYDRSARVLGASAQSGVDPHSARAAKTVVTFRAQPADAVRARWHGDVGSRRHDHR